MPTFATPGPIAATVQVAGAQVRVTASDRTDTVVLVEPINKASRSDVKVADRTKVDFAGGRLSVKTTVSGDRTGSVAITIDLPAGSSLVAYLAHSGVRADGSLGECELHMASGRVQLDRINALQANIAAGEVAIGHIAGRANIDGSRGQVSIGHASADLDLSSASGSLDIDRADGSVTATTASGAIRIGRMTQGHAKLVNGSGNIEVGISEGSAAYLDVNSERGSVRNSVAQEDPGESDAKVSVHARTRHGDIIIRRAAGSGTANAHRRGGSAVTVTFLDRRNGTTDGLPCRVHDPELWFAADPAEVELAKALCRDCPVRDLCLQGALERREPWGVWGGELFLQGAVIPRKRPPGRPRKHEQAA